jgi:hypothetical protein
MPLISTALFSASLLTVASSSGRLPRWDLPEPNTSLPLAGLQLLHGTRHAVAYTSHSMACNPPRQQPQCQGTYNHAPIVVRLANGALFLGWHNEEYDEDSGGGRALFSTSVNGGLQWSGAGVLFGNLSTREQAPSTVEAATPPSPPAESSHAAAAAAGWQMTPFCALDTVGPKVFIKVGGDPRKRCGWDGGHLDKCCRRASRLHNDCRWYANESACTAALTLAVAQPSTGYCEPCATAPNTVGCPASWIAPGPGPAPPSPTPSPLPDRPFLGTNLYLTGFFSPPEGQRMYVIAAAYNLVCSAKCRLGGVDKCSTGSCCTKCLACCDCASRQKLPLLMRRVEVDARSGESTLGPVFWATGATLPPFAPPSAHTFPLLSAMDAQTQRDAEYYRAAAISGMVPTPPAPMQKSETSITWQQPVKPSLRAGTGAVTDAEAGQPVDLAMLIRDDGTPSSLREWASLCSVPAVNRSVLSHFAAAVANGELPLVLGAKCNWTMPLRTGIPDSRALTHAGILPAASGDGQAWGLRYLLGNQLPKLFDRDPLTISLSTDGGEHIWRYLYQSLSELTLLGARYHAQCLSIASSQCGAVPQQSATQDLARAQAFNTLTRPWTLRAVT